ncbi:hypothetical protein BDW22DRAFT_1354319 [Trametopsis cervina]|nr:hypothetical protein BDW22DRAFT_1354319 [Trametopsis cervina]
MPRELRSRASRPNYARFLADDDQEEAGPTNIQEAADKEVESGSDFAPEDKAQHDDKDDDAMSEDDGDHDDVSMEQEPDNFSPVTPRKGGRKSANKTPRSTAGKKSTSHGRKSLPLLPSVHHRHRAFPLYYKGGEVERLDLEPGPFKPDTVVFTNAWGSGDTVLRRVAKAWGTNVGPGPLWELLEDRGWYTEHMSANGDTKEEDRRPRVYSDLKFQPDLDLLQVEEAEQYLPQRTAQDSAPKPENLIHCWFGPHGKQERVEMHRFSHLSMGRFFPQSTSHVFNAGAPVWGVDWCPIHPEDRPETSHRQYLAVAPLPSYDYTPKIGVKVPRPNPACIQIWSLNATNAAESDEADSGRMSCDMVLCIDIGPAHELKWCPLPSGDSLKDSDNASTRRLGLLAGAFEDGSVSIFAVPFPSDLQRESADAEAPIYIKAKPVARFELEETACWCLDWANSEVIAVGCSNGYIAVFDVAEALKNPDPDEAPLPTYYSSVHQSAIRSITWIRAPSSTSTGEDSPGDPSVLVSASYDGMLGATDTRTPCGNEIYRTRDVVNTVCYAPYVGGPVSIDQGQVKSVSFSAVMLNKGHTVIEPEGPVWSLSASDYHPQLAVGVADGSCQTTNTLRNTRRGGTVPFLSHKIYQLDYNRDSGEYRMLEHFLPKEIEKIAVAKMKSAPKAIGAWPPQVGVTRVVWNNGNGLGRASLLASTTASGLCRIDWLVGRWSKNKIPYEGIEGVRAEDDAAEGSDDESE